MASKFWAINATGNWSPNGNIPQAFYGKVNGNTVTTDNTTVSAIIAIGATSATLSGFGPITAAATGATSGTITLGVTYVGESGTFKMSYYNKTKPAGGVDGPISAILPIASSPAGLVIIGGNGLPATFAAGSLKQGTLYPIAINQVTTVTSGDFIGFSDF
jgi:hypothetical protein